MSNYISDIKKSIQIYKWIAKYTRGYKLSIAAIFVYGVIIALSSVGVAVASKNLIDNAMTKISGAVVKYVVLLAGLLVLNLGIAAVSSLTTTRVLESFSNSLRQRLFARISGTEWIYISRYHSGDVLTRLTSDVSTVANGVVNVLPSIMILGIQMMAAFAIMLYYEPVFALMAFVLGPVSVLFSRIWGKRLKKIHLKIQESESAYRSFIQENIENLTIVKAFRMEDRKIDAIEDIHNDRMNWVIRRNRLNVAVSTTLSGGYWLSYLLTIIWGSVRLAQNATSFGTFTAFLQLIGQIQGPFIGLARTLPQVIATTASAGRIMELENLEMEKQEGKLAKRLSLEVRLIDVDFSYNKEETVLDKVTFNLKPGETLALVGPSGEGKTTIIRLLLALLRPDGGRVFFKDDHGTEYPASAATRDWVSYVPQGNTLFSGTIAENIRAGSPEASDEEIRKAAVTACAWEFIEKLPEGVNTVLGEHGLGLSEGQVQRISLARAILRNVPILILDEATSALDMDLEMRVLEGIKNLKPARACLVITHRLSALQICSRVIKLNEGKIIEQPMDYYSRVR